MLLDDASERCTGKLNGAARAEDGPVPVVVLAPPSDASANDDETASSCSEGGSVHSLGCSTGSSSTASLSSLDHEEDSETPGRPGPVDDVDVRIRLCTSPEVLFLLNELWEAVHTPRPDGEYAPETMDFDRYVRTHMLIQRVVLRVPPHDVAAATLRAKKDWETDREGGPAVPRHRFYASNIQISAIQSRAPGACRDPAHSPFARCRAYLERLFEAVTVVDPRTGLRRLRLAAEVTPAVLERLASDGAEGGERPREAPRSRGLRAADPESSLELRRAAAHKRLADAGMPVPGPHLFNFL